MKKLTPEEKKKTLDLKLSEPDSAVKLVDARRSNQAPEYDSDALRKRSARTAAKRAKMLHEAAKSLSKDE